MQWFRAVVLLGAAAAGTVAVISQYRAWRRHRAVARPEPVGQEEEQANVENDTETAPTRTRTSTRIVARQVNRRTYVFLEIFLVTIAILLALLASVSNNMMVLAAFLLWVVLRILATTTPLSTGFDVIQEEQEEKEEEEQELQKPTVGIDGVPDSLEPHRFLGLVSEADEFETIPLIETSFPFKFEDVIDAFFELFGSPHFPTAVVQHDSSRSPDHNPSTQFRRRKILHPINVPFLLRSLARGLDGIEVDERSVTDPDRRTASVYSRNTNCRSIAIIFEELVIRPHPSNPTWTLMTRTCSLSMRMQSSLRVAVEHALRVGFVKKAADANQALQALIEERVQHRSDSDHTIE